MIRFNCFAILILCSLSNLQESRADWPQFRGANRDGISTETGLVKSWPAGGPPLVWKATGLGGSYITPSVVNGVIYGGGYRGGNEVVWALDASTGKEIWSTSIAPANHDFNFDEGPRSTPTIDGELMFTLSGAGELNCLNNKSGKVIWTRNLKKDFGGKMMSGWGYSESPLVDGSKLLCMPGGSKGTVLALNKKTGKAIWQSSHLTDEAAYTCLVKAEIQNVPQYIAFTGRSLSGISSGTGEVLWSAARKGRTAVVPTPIVDGNRIWVTSGYNAGCNLFEVSKLGGKFSAKEIYADKGIKNHHGGAIKVGEHIYASSGVYIVCMEMKTGKVAWKERSVGKGALGYADGHLYLRSEKGPIALIEANPEKYVEKGRFDQPDRSKEKSWPHPVISDGRLYLLDMDILLSYNVKQ
ncbi:MAG TPA: polyvinylalcohol dehydrogenase [Verrucomicrobiales bacterium]|nr:polyvinylalcohol dehydrogenase [Verrucomicrobiales bacterium]HIL69894.1 polyvinylalcohol dehydrogenase [Verrucomicrobiota bacterium]